VSRTTCTCAHREVGSDAKRNSIYAIHPVTLAAGGVAHALFGIAEFANFSAPTFNLITAHRLKVLPPNQLSTANVSFTTQTCAST
jgi:hypothetical protein